MASPASAKGDTQQLLCKVKYVGVANLNFRLRIRIRFHHVRVYALF